MKKRKNIIELVKTGAIVSAISIVLGGAFYCNKTPDKNPQISLHTNPPLGA